MNNGTDDKRNRTLTTEGMDQRLLFGQNDSFLRQGFVEGVSEDKLLAAPVPSVSLAPASVLAPKSTPG